MPIPIVDWSKMEWTRARPGIERKAFSAEGVLNLDVFTPRRDEYA